MARLTVNEAGTSGYTHVISLSFDDLAKIKLGTDPFNGCLLYTSPSPRDATKSRIPS